MVKYMPSVASNEMIQSPYCSRPATSFNYRGRVMKIPHLSSETWSIFNEIATLSRHYTDHLFVL
jgi:hypothetical protein